MAPIFRNDQVVFAFSPEAAQGAYPESATGTIVTSSPFTDTLNGAVKSGATSIVVDDTASAVANLAVGDFIMIGQIVDTDHSVRSSEIRRVEHIAGTTIHLDVPLGFRHEDEEPVIEIQNNVTAFGNTTKSDYPLITLTPGIWETIDVPDMEPTITPRWFIGTGQNRAFSTVTRGAQNYVGSVPNFVLLDGTALRYPIGKVTSTASARKGWTHALAGTAHKGSIYICVTSRTNILTGDNIEIDDGGTNPEIRKVVDLPATQSGVIASVAAASSPRILTHTVMTDVAHGLKEGDGITIADTTNHDGVELISAVTTDTFEIEDAYVEADEGTWTASWLQLDHPLQFDHAAGASYDEVDNDDGLVYYTHTIAETVDLDTVSWHVSMLDSAESVYFDRRYYGGHIGSMTISADEGELLTASWDSVNFMGMVHNQATRAGMAGSDYSQGETSMPFYELMHQITTTEVSAEAPTTEPYYFSRGVVTFFGSEFARVRNFNIGVSNNTEARHYITQQFGNNRGPSEITEGRREYTMSCTLALPDSDATESATVAKGTTIFKELLLEGDYGAGGNASINTGFAITLTFTRGTNDTITITIPDDGTPLTGIGNGGAYITAATHSVTTDGPLQVEADVLFRNMKIVVVDSKYLYA